MASTNPLLVSENGGGDGSSNINGHKPHNNISSSSLLSEKSTQTPFPKIPYKDFAINLQPLFGTKLSLFFPAVPLAILAHYHSFGRTWVFILSLLGLTPLAERISFLTEQISYYTTPTVGGLLNATCGNATELIIVIFALIHHKVNVVKYSLLGSILSELLLVLGSSLLCGGLANISVEQKFDQKQTSVNLIFLMLALSCNMLLLMSHCAGKSNAVTAKAKLVFSRVSSIVMLIAYSGYLVFQLWTHREVCKAKEGEDEDDNEVSKESAVVGFWSGLVWLAGMTAFTALLSEYVVGTIEDASESWAISVDFISIIIIPIVGNAAEHAGAIVFAFKNKLDITLSIALGSATQIAVFVVPLSVIVAWIMGINMDLYLMPFETVSLAISILISAFTLQDGTCHYIKGLVLLLCYIVIGAFLFISS
ncbi:hypothetical protein LguiA_032088 [Lonicera macranthoides]